MPHQVHQEQAVLCPGVTGAEHRPGAGGPGDVRDAERLVAHDRHVRAGSARAGDVRAGHAVRGIVEEGVDLRRRQAGVPVRQVRVGSELIVGVCRHRAEHLVGEDLGEVGVPVLPRRQDVGALAEAVVAGGESRGGRLLIHLDEGRGGQQGDGKKGDQLGKASAHGRGPFGERSNAKIVHR